MERTGISSERGALAIVLALLPCIAPALQGGVQERLPTAIFAFDQHPDLPLSAYASGRLGIVQPTYARSYLYVAYRWMKGAPLSPEEAAETNRYWTDRLAGQTPARSSGAPETYDALRGSLGIPWQAPRQPNGRAATQFLAVDYVYYSKCADHAFATAAETLRARIEQFGADSGEVAEWVLGQDFVFENCFGETSGFIPPAAPAEVDPLIHADREYQVAAALFYAARYEEAAAAFRRVSENARSPWAGWGRYLAGRSLLWDARTKGENAAGYQERLDEAAADLGIAAGADGPQQARDAANWLLARILMRSDPGAAAALLSRRLLSPAGASTRAAELGLFTQVMDRLAKDSASLAKAREGNELVDWIFTLQDKGEKAGEHALERWQSDGSLVWLAATLAKIGPGHPAASELIDTADTIHVGPAAALIAYHRARLLMDRGKREEARVVLDGLLPRLEGLDSSRNRALSMRATLARDQKELLLYGVRLPAFLSHVYQRVSYVYWREQAYYSPWRLSQEARMQLEPRKDELRWGPETAEILNGGVPLDVLAGMLDLNGLPERLRTELLLATWTRAVLLDRWDLARALAPRIGSAAPSMTEDMQALLAAKEPDAMKFFAVNALLKTPGASVTLRSGPLRAGPLYRPDPNGLNWWWGSPTETSRVEFLSEEQRQTAAAEKRRVLDVGEGFRWLVGQAIRAAESPSPPAGAAKALYRAMACLDVVEMQSGYQPLLETRESRARAIETLEHLFPEKAGTIAGAHVFQTTRSH